MIDYGRYYNNVSDAFWGCRPKVCKDARGQFRHGKVRRAVMMRCARLELYISRVEGNRHD